MADVDKGHSAGVTPARFASANCSWLSARTTLRSVRRNLRWPPNAIR